MPRFRCGTVASPHALIPVLVTGIQPRRVGAVNDSHAGSAFPAPKDLGALDSCDGHRNEGGRGGICAKLAVSVVIA